MMMTGLMIDLRRSLRKKSSKKGDNLTLFSNQEKERKRDREREKERKRGMKEVFLCDGKSDEKTREQERSER